MVKTEIISSLAALSSEELEEVQIAIFKLRDSDWLDPTLTAEDKAALKEALDDYEQNPSEGIPWETLKAELDAKYKR